MKHKFLGVAAILFAVVFASCSHMIQDLKIAELELTVIQSSMVNPDNVVKVTVEDDIPDFPKPTATYKLPDGTTKTVEGTVTTDEDGKKVIIFDLTPISKVPGGELPVDVNVPGYKPTTITVNYIPPVVVKLESDGITYTAGDDVLVSSDENGTISEPVVKTNYTEDAISVEKKYYIEGSSVPVDWSAIQDYLNNPENKGKKVTVKVVAKPTPDTNPTSGKTSKFYVSKTEKPFINITGTEVKNPEGIIIVDIDDDDIPYTPKPTVTYKLEPDGEEVEIRGTVEEYEDEDDLDEDGNPKKKKRIIFDLKPINPRMPVGKLPIVIKVEPNYRPTSETVDFYPPVITKVTYDDEEYEDGEEIKLDDDDDIETLPEPVITTNYDDDKVEIVTTYEDEDGNPIGDLDGDGKPSWGDVKKYYNDPEHPENKGKKVKVKIEGTPKPNTTPSGKTTTEIVIVPKPVVKTGKPETKEPEGIVYIPVDDDIPETPRPILTYESYPDGEPVEVPGTVEEYYDNEDLDDNGNPKKKKRIKFCWIPRPRGGDVPGTVIVEGYQPTPIEVPDYKPPVIIKIEVDGKEYEEGEEIVTDKDNFPGKPNIHTNYDEDDVEIKTTYEDEDGNPIEDKDGDSDKDWDAVKKYYEDPDNEGKKVKIKVEVTPKTDPTSKKVSEFEITPKPVVKVNKIEETEEPAGVIVYTDDDIPENPKPIIRYNRYPDGEPVEVEGTVETYTDDSEEPPVERKRIIFKYNPKPRGGKLPVQIEVEGYKPTEIEGVEYHPPVIIKVNFDGHPYEDGDEIKVEDDEDIDEFEPIIITNYNDEDIEKETTYEDEDGNPIGDLDGDDDVDWDDVKEYYKKPEHKGKRIKIKVKVTPKPDTTPTGKQEVTVDFVPKPVVKIGQPETKEPEGIIYFPVDDDIPTTPRPILTYEGYPDGEPVEIEGEVEEYTDDSVEPSVIRKRIKFNWNPRPRPGTVPGTIIIDGYRPTPVEVEGYKPPVIIKVEKDGKPVEDGEEIVFSEDEDEFPGRPTITTNYDDDDDDDDDGVEIEEEYFDKDGNPIEDLDDDGNKPDWDDVVIFTKDPENHDKLPVTVIVHGKPKGSDDPDLEKTFTYKIGVRTVVIDITVETNLFTLTAIKHGDTVDFVVTTNIQTSSYVWLIDGVQQPQTSESLTVDTTTMEPGEHTVTVVTVKNGIPYSSEASLTVN
ncbi:MAG: hypothetical protein K6A43_07740 [Treponema sp.]|nr:hypothetical protein [Treponema sp.]